MGALGSAAYSPPGISRELGSRVAAAPLATGVPAILGTGVMTTGERVLYLSRWEQFASRIERPDDYLAGAVKGFFDCGGQQCAVVIVDRPSPSDPAGSGQKSWEDAVGLLQDLESIDLICAPSLMLPAAKVADPAGVQQQILKTCEQRGDCFAILDVSYPATPDVGDPTTPRLNDVRVLDLPDELLRHGALYYPWVSTDGRTPLPPCGHVAGIYAVSDRRSGPHRSPANELLTSVVGLMIPSDDPLGAGTNLLRVLPGAGIRVWGARTLVKATSPASPWAFIGVRRLFTSVARQLLHLTAWAAFEPNDLRLWIRLTRQLQSFFLDLYHRGALKGGSAAEAFYVKCDEETNPPRSRDQGQVIVELGLAPALPAEFIRIRLTQATTGATVSA